MSSVFGNHWILGLLVVACGSGASKINIVTDVPAVEIETACVDDCEPEPLLLNEPTRVIPGMAVVPEGWFVMGCDHSDWKCENDELPAHRVWLPSFHIDRYEVTTSAYRECVDASVCVASHESHDGCNATHPDRDNHPVNCVSWVDAMRYCEWRAKRLPTEAEWEKASRGEQRRLFPWGDEEATCGHGVMNNGCGEGSTLAVGSRPAGASPYGVHDMAGNVWEWVADWFVAGYAAADVRSPVGPKTGTERVIRGGSWDDLWAAKAMRSAARSSNGPTTSGSHLGFRCAATTP